LGDHTLKRVDAFRYLGRFVTDTNSDSRAIAERIRLAAATHQNIRRRVLRSSATSMRTRLRMYTAVIGAQLLFGAETWTPNLADLRKLETFHNRNLRAITNMLPDWDGDRVTGHIKYPHTYAVLKAAKQPPMQAVVDDATLRFYGHILRRPAADDLRFMLDARIVALRPRPGHHSTLLPDRMRALADQAGLKPSDASTRASWRTQRKTLLEKRTAAAHEPAPPRQLQAPVGTVNDD